MDEKNPGHVAIILDGNRRFAKRLMLEPWKGHEYGARKVEELINYAKSLGILELTLYCLSSENIKSRPKDELQFLFKIFKKEFENMDRQKLKLEGIKIRFIGDLGLLPDDLKQKCLELENETRDNSGFIVNFAIAYGGKQEITNAIKMIINEGIKSEDINEGVIKSKLWLKSEPDMIIRTGGEKRTSNFLLWQSDYSEWFFLDKMWPEFCRADLLNCIEEFRKRKRNFGA